MVLRHFHHTVNGIYMWVYFAESTTLSQLTSSWEYFTTLDYELDVIRGRCPHQWTIWVCIDGHFFLTSEKLG